MFNKTFHVLISTGSFCFLAMCGLSAAEGSALSASEIVIDILGPIEGGRPQSRYCSYVSGKIKELIELNSKYPLYIYPSDGNRSITAIPIQGDSLTQLKLDDLAKDPSEVHVLPVLKIEGKIAHKLLTTKRQPIFYEGGFTEKDIKKEVVTADDLKEIDELNKNSTIKNLRDINAGLIAISSIPSSRKLPEIIVGTQYSAGLVPGGTLTDGDRFQQDLNYTRIGEVFRALSHGPQLREVQSSSFLSKFLSFFSRAASFLHLRNEIGYINKPGENQKDLLLLKNALSQQEGTEMVVLEANKKLEDALPIVKNLKKSS